jgi:hypothetical protein
VELATAEPWTVRKVDGARGSHFWKPAEERFPIPGKEMRV